MAKQATSAEKIEAFDRLVATQPKVERKGAANPYTAVNGNMFSCLHPPGRLALRLPEEEREKFLHPRKGTPNFPEYPARSFKTETA